MSCVMRHAPDIRPQAWASGIACRRSIIACHAQDFFRRRVSGFDPALAVLTHVAHAGGLGGAAHGLFAGAGMHETADVVVDDEQFMDARAAAVPGVAAFGTTDRAPCLSAVR